MPDLANLLKISSIRWQSVVDFVVLSIVIYWLLDWARQTRVLRLFVGIGCLVLTGSAARRLDLIVTAWILHVAAIAAVLLLVVVYHTEIRQALTRLDPLSRLVRSLPVQLPDQLAIAEAVFSMAATCRGALIVLAGKDSLGNIVNGGVPLGWAVSKEILEAIFRKVSPVHDGAVIIENGRISRVGVFLPLTSREDLPKYYGTRHRAAIGLAEQSDAKVIVVSEERGEVSLVEGPRVYPAENSDRLVELMQTADPPSPLPTRQRLLNSLYRNLRLKLSALGIASLIWGLVFMTGTSVRTFTVPVEFENVPVGLEISEPANNLLVVQLRAATQLFATLDESQLVIRIDLRGMTGGVHSIEVKPDNLNLPPGISLEKAVPRALRIRLVPR
jgi:diadenylate cyclase